jgi:hypothetical protein
MPSDAAVEQIAPALRNGLRGGARAAERRQAKYCWPRPLVARLGAGLSCHAGWARGRSDLPRQEIRGQSAHPAAGWPAARPGCGVCRRLLAAVPVQDRLQIAELGGHVAAGQLPFEPGPRGARRGCRGHASGPESTVRSVVLTARARTACPAADARGNAGVAAARPAWALPAGPRWPAGCWSGHRGRRRSPDT